MAPQHHLSMLRDLSKAWYIVRFACTLALNVVPKPQSLIHRVESISELVFSQRNLCAGCSTCGCG